MQSRREAGQARTLSSVRTQGELIAKMVPDKVEKMTRSRGRAVLQAQGEESFRRTQPQAAHILKRVLKGVGLGGEGFPKSRS